VFVLLDWYSIYTSNPDPFPDYIYNWKVSQNNGLRTFHVHGDGLHVSFVDGHVDWMVGLLKDKSKPSNSLQSMARGSDW
jgi:prepilin-type processing-associated H-X9-DG protein